MPRWMKPTEEMPSLEAGDRILVIIDADRYSSVSKKRRLRCVILEATEDGWDSPDATYVGYTPEDGVLWAYEKDVCQIANILDR